MDIDIDLPSINRQKVFDVVQRYLRSIGGDIVRVATFSTETAKSAILTACRGKGINNDVAQHLSNLIPIERGKVRDLHTVYYGKEDIEPIHEFKRICDEYSHLNLIETAFGIEGLVKNRSIHSCGVIIVTEEFTKHNAKMVAPNGEMITSWSLGECEYVGNLKYDFEYLNMVSNYNL